jgi:glycosyltransferase involved in cell wall biosynthesis
VNVDGVHAPGSIGVARYVGELEAALRRHGVGYRPAPAPNGGWTHFHLANSSRRPLWQSIGARRPYVVTVHDVVPRARALRTPARLAMPLALRRAARVVVHSRFAADFLLREVGGLRGRVEVVPHPARRPADPDRAAARRALGWPLEPPIALLPGVLKAAKLVAEAIVAAEPLIRAGEWRLALAGPLRDQGLAESAASAGAWLLRDASDEEYERALVAADLVLVLRRESVGETNGPLLDALGAGRATLATCVGSIPEVAGDAVAYCEPSVDGIRAALRGLDPGVRLELERRASARAAALDWDTAAAAHAELFREVFDA